MTDPSEVLLRYFRTLDGGDLAGAAQLFAADALYVVPSGLRPLTGTSGQERRLTTVRGRDQIEARLAQRGVLPHQHHVHHHHADGRTVWMLGSVTPDDDRPAEMVFASVATVDDTGAIARYVTFSADVLPTDVADVLG